MKQVAVVTGIALVCLCVTSCLQAYSQGDHSQVLLAQAEPDEPMLYEQSTEGELPLPDITYDEEIPLESLSDKELKDLGFTDEEIKELRMMQNEQ